MLLSVVKGFTPAARVASKHGEGRRREERVMPNLEQGRLGKRALRLAWRMGTMPATIGKYRIERELGQGATGTVYLGYDAFRDQRVAVKQIHPHLMADAAQSKRHRRMLHNEAVLAGQLHHPHLVRVIDVDEQAEPPYLVLEYVQGKSLASFTSPATLLPVPQVLDIAFKCCNALEYAQTQGLVHRDIKPANLLLQDNGEVKLTDFGTALSMRGDKTHLLGLIGSPAYMAPEQIKEESVTHHADMFSLAIVIYELRAGTTRSRVTPTLRRCTGSTPSRRSHCA